MRQKRHHTMAGAQAVVHRCIRWCKGRDSGAITAEFAVVLPAIVVAGVLLLVLARAGVVSMTCQNAASAAVRSAVISDDDGKARAVAQQVAGAHAGVSLRHGAGQVTAVVSCPIAPDPLRVLPGAIQGKATGAEQ